LLAQDFSSVLQPILWREAGKTESIFEGFRDTKRIAVYLALGTALLIPLAQLVFHLVVNLITTNYIDSIPIFYVLSYNLYLIPVVTIPAKILNSSIVNKQNVTLSFYAIGLVLNIIFDLLVIKLGYGVVGVAWVTICTQGLVTFMLYRFIKGYIFQDMREFLSLMAKIIFPFLVIIPFYFFHNYLTATAANPWIFAGLSLAAQAVLWSLVIGIFYRGYISGGAIRAIMTELNTVIEGRLRRRR